MWNKSQIIAIDAIWNINKSQQNTEKNIIATKNWNGI